MKELDKKKNRLEIIKVNAAKAEFEYRIEERLDEIERLKEQIKIQDGRIDELEKMLKG